MFDVLILSFCMSFTHNITNNLVNKLDYHGRHNRARMVYLIGDYKLKIVTLLS